MLEHQHSKHIYGLKAKYNNIETHCDQSTQSLTDEGQSVQHFDGFNENQVRKLSEAINQMTDMQKECLLQMNSFQPQFSQLNKEFSFNQTVKNSQDTNNSSILRNSEPTTNNIAQFEVQNKLIIFQQGKEGIHDNAVEDTQNIWSNQNINQQPITFPQTFIQQKQNNQTGSQLNSQNLNNYQKRLQQYQENSKIYNNLIFQNRSQERIPQNMFHTFNRNHQSNLSGFNSLQPDLMNSNLINKVNFLNLNYQYQPQLLIQGSNQLFPEVQRQIFNPFQQVQTHQYYQPIQQKQEFSQAQPVPIKICLPSPLRQPQNVSTHNLNLPQAHCNKFSKKILLLKDLNKIKRMNQERNRKKLLSILANYSLMPEYKDAQFIIPKEMNEFDKKIFSDEEINDFIWEHKLIQLESTAQQPQTVSQYHKQNQSNQSSSQYLLTQMPLFSKKSTYFSLNSIQIRSVNQLYQQDKLKSEVEEKIQFFHSNNLLNFNGKTPQSLDFSSINNQDKEEQTQQIIKEYEKNEQYFICKQGKKYVKGKKHNLSDSTDSSEGEMNFDNENQTIRNDCIDWNMKIGNISLKARHKIIKKYKEKVYKRRSICPVIKKFDGRKRVANNKIRLNGRFVKADKLPISQYSQSEMYLKIC